MLSADWPPACATDPLTSLSSCPNSLPCWVPPMLPGWAWAACTSTTRDKVTIGASRSRTTCRPPWSARTTPRDTSPTVTWSRPPCSPKWTSWPTATRCATLPWRTSATTRLPSPAPAKAPCQALGRQLTCARLPATTNACTATTTKLNTCRARTMSGPTTHLACNTSQMPCFMLTLNSNIRCR
jgi:hypothetical protein